MSTPGWTWSQANPAARSDARACRAASECALAAAAAAAAVEFPPNTSVSSDAAARLNDSETCCQVAPASSIALVMCAIVQ
jgi:hypothetical protein